ncbi:MAG TPA: hypothetical protein VHZ81_14440 [Galbitalea sp.]|jgi:hypothetical protein|nr:hypothetical protein [Galbitalea sp.]
MANTRTARSFPLAAWLLVLGGVLYLLIELLSHIGAGSIDGVLAFIAYLALTVAFVVFFLWRSIDLLLRIAFIVAAVGFALLALANIATLGAVPLKIADVLVLVGVLVAGIIVFVRHIFTRGAGLSFLILGIVTALLFLSALVTFITGTLLVILAVLFGVLLIVTGVLIARRR